MQRSLPIYSLRQRPILQSIPPKPDEIEVSLFGPGFGESVVIHVGHGEWIVVDSCVEERNGDPKPLQYLCSLGVDPATAVTAVVATHWHDDHVAGLGNLLDACRNAVLVCSVALTTKEFLELAQLYEEAPGLIPPGPKEIQKALRIAAERSHRLKRCMLCYALANRPIWRSAKAGAQAVALSPSDEMVRRSLQRVARACEIAKKGNPILDRLESGPNDVAAAIRIDVGGRSILLGSDLEASTNPLVGWSAVLQAAEARSSRSMLYKVAHHGARSGHQDEVWNSLLTPSPLAFMSPFQLGGNRLPTRADRTRILERTDKAYITVDPDKRRPRPAKRAPKIETFIASATLERSVAYGAVGHIRWRAPVAVTSDPGAIDLFNEAMALQDTVRA